MNVQTSKQASKQATQATQATQAQATQATPASYVADVSAAHELALIEAYQRACNATRIADATQAHDVALLEQQCALECASALYVQANMKQVTRVHVGAKQALRELFDTGASFTLAELCKLTGKSEVNVRTQLSDMRSAKYAGKHGVYMTKATRSNGVTLYSKA